MKYNLLKSEFESRNILFLLIIIISFYQISVLNIDQLFYHIYPKLQNLASEKTVSLVIIPNALLMIYFSIFLYLIMKILKKNIYVWSIIHYIY